MAKSGSMSAREASIPAARGHSGNLALVECVALLLQVGPSVRPVTPSPRNSGGRPLMKVIPERTCTCPHLGKEKICAARPCRENE